MIRLLHTLPEEMKKKTIYIWDVSKDSVTEFTKLAVRLIDIKGFVTQEESYVGDYYMNRPIVGTEEFLNDENGVVILSEKCVRYKIPAEINKKAVLLSELLQIDEKLKEKKVYIYGTGVGGKNIYAELTGAGVDITAFCVTKKENLDVLHNKRVYQINEIQQDNRDAFIISVFSENTRQEMIDMLDMRGAEIYIRDFLQDYMIFAIALFQSVHKAWYEKKKIYIYTKTLGGYFELIKAVLELYGMEISGYVCKEAEREAEIQDVFELAYENTGDIYVLVNDLDMLERREQIEVYDLLESIGLSMCKFEYAGFYPVSMANWQKNIIMTADPLVGWSALYGKENLPGVNVIGNMDRDDIGILVLGGSTSTDGIFRTTSWVRQLYHKLTARGLAITIYDCAGPDEDVLQELLRLIRDGVHLHPQYIISMSGVNNEMHRLGEIENKANLRHTIEWYKILSPKAPFVCGVPVREDAFAYWVRIERVIKAVAEQNGSKFYCFLQPMKESKEKLTAFERSVHFSGDANNEIASFRQGAGQDDFYTNLLSLFDEEEGMFIDNCHYSEKAGSILAEIVSKELLKDLVP